MFEQDQKLHSTQDLLAVDPDLETEYGESAYESGIESDTTSLSESVLNFEYENGRRFHGYRSGKYYLPNDEKEQDRLDLLSHCIGLAYGGHLYGSPLEKNKPQKAIDIGAGTGLWAINFADEFPECEVVGTDLSPIQPSWVPPNLFFEITDAEEPWHWQSASVDFVHLRDMSYSLRDWDHVMSEAMRVLRPGGWLEIQDWKEYYKSDDDSIKADNVSRKWVEATKKATDAIGLPNNRLAQTSRQRFKKAGFENYHIVEKKFPFGPWPRDKKLKQLGLYCRQWALDTAEGATNALLTRTIGWSLERCEETSKASKLELVDPKIHAYHIYAYMYAQKPSGGLK